MKDNLIKEVVNDITRCAQQFGLDQSIRQRISDKLVPVLKNPGWIDINDEQPNHGQNVIAVGTWEGEINGTGEDGYMGIGRWMSHKQHVDVDSDGYYLWITNVTHWQPLPEHP